MLDRADVVTVHVPLTRATRGLIGRDAIARLKPGSIVLNVARGGVVDEAAVAEALRSGHLGGAGIDVFEQEPPTGSPLLDAPEHAADAAPRRVDRRGPGPRLRGGRRPGPRRARRPERALRGQRPAAHPGDGPRDRAVPAAGRGPRPVLRPVLARRRAHADPRDRRRAGRVRRHAADRRGPARAARDLDHRAGQPGQRRAPWPRPAGSPSSSARRPTPGRSPRC